MSYAIEPTNCIREYLPSRDRYSKNIYRKLGNTGIQLPMISLGLWQNFGDEEIFANAREIILKAFDYGITHFDLGNNYGRPPGSAELNLGRILKSHLAAYRDELFIATKAGYDMWPGPYGAGSSRKYLIASLNQSLKRLNIDYVDLFYSHRVDPETPLEETIDALAHIVHSGKALYVGISSYSVDATKKALRLADEAGIKIVAHQASYSMLNRWVEEDLLDTLQQYGVGCIAFSPLQQGVLTGKYSLHQQTAGTRLSKPQHSIPLDNLNPEIHQVIKQLNTIAKERQQTLAELALAWALRTNKVTSLVIGASTPDQILENLHALENLQFTASELEAIDKICGKMDYDLWKKSRTAEVV